MFYEEVKKLQTKDGKLFDYEDEVEEYIVDALASEINEWIKKAPTNDLKYRDLVEIIKALVGDNHKIKRLSNLLNKYM